MPINWILRPSSEFRSILHSPRLGTGRSLWVEHESPDLTAPADDLPSLEELLPEKFNVLTRPWRGDLDGMAERRAIRVLVVSGGPQFFYDHGKPRGITAELLDEVLVFNSGASEGIDSLDDLAGQAVYVRKSSS